MKSKYMPVQKSLKNLLTKNGLEEVYYFSFLKKNWSNILNPNLAKVSLPAKLEDKILTIKVNSDLWKSEFLERLSLLVKMINKKLDDYKIENIEII
jgi:predicted nucleic acid-binding Zn ribbon protein